MLLFVSIDSYIFRYEFKLIAMKSLRVELYEQKERRGQIFTGREDCRVIFNV